MEVSALEYYIGQALNAQVAKFGAEIDSENAAAIAAKAVLLGRATYAAAIAAAKANQQPVRTVPLDV